MDLLQKAHRLNATEDIVGLKRSTIYKKIQDGEFPKPIKISERAVAWLESDLQEWLSCRIAESRKSEGGNV